MSKLSPDQWRALSPHLDEALDMTDEQRSTWLSSLQTENPALASQLEILLQEHRALSEDGFLEESTVELPGAPGLAGQTFGVYTLVSQIGHGGMGSVWLAERNDGRFERRVAVKVLDIGLMGKVGEERFKREGSILGRLTHPNIAELIDAGVSQTGQPFLVLEYVEGDHIDRYCDQNTLDVRARQRLFLDALRAVAQAHDNRIVHRDLKPSNIVVRTDGQAKRNCQAAGSGRTDREPPRPSEMVALTQGNGENAITNARKRATTPDKLARTLRGDLDTIVAKALKKNPQERYPSIKAFADDLQKFLQYQPISARPDAIGYRAGKFVRRHRSSVVAALVIMLALIGTGVFTWLYPRRTAPLTQYIQRKLTANAQDSPVLSAAISPDGKYLGYADQQGIHLQLVETKAAQNLPLLPGAQAGTAFWAFGSWFPDSTRFIASASMPGRPSTLWSIPTQGGEAQKLTEVEDMFGGGIVSPDGSNIAYQRVRSSDGAREIWVMGSHGESPHKVLTAERQVTFQAIAWSPAGNRLAYRSRLDKSNHTEIKVQSCDLSGADITTILLDNHLSAFTWTSSGRFIYSRNIEFGSAQSDNLWELKVDGRNGKPQGKGRLLTDWSGFAVYSLSATADGKQLVFLRGTDHSSVFVGDLAGKEDRLVNFRRLTLDDNYNIPSAWTPDSRDVIFSSERATNRQMYRQALEQGSAPQLLSPAANTNFYLARLSPDGAWILLEGEPLTTRKMGLYRVDPRGGVPQRIFEIDGFVVFSCSNQAANLCVFGRPSADKSELVVASFDPLGGPGKELVRIPLETGSSADLGFDYWWQLSPDGSQIGIVKWHSHEIRLVPLRGGQTRTITVKGFPDLLHLEWANDSQSTFVSTFEPGGSNLLRVALNGDALPVWHQPHSKATWGFPSPDGRHLAIMGSNSESNVWIISNF
jgi:Tol biopolymer transport system component